jgi:uncharacterized protein
MKRFRSGLYEGEVVHQRFAPRRHRLRYAVFQMLFDLDETDRLADGLRLFSHNRLNAFSLHDADHGDRDGAPLRGYVERILAAAGIEIEGGRIELLCMPRVLGLVFNPLSVYYCHHRDGALAAMIYEVSNTFGQRHSYLIPADQTAGEVVKQSCEKDFYVSPFMDMEMTYEFRLAEPGDRAVTTINGRGPDGTLLIFASFTGARRELDDRTLLRLLLAYPFMTIGVVLAIHWEALKLFAKGLKLRRRPPAPKRAVTVVRPG